MANISIKFLRSKNVLGSYTLAVEKLKSLNLAYGQPAVVKYYDGSEEDANIRLLLGVGYQQGDINTVLEVASFESVNAVKKAVTELDTKIGDLNSLEEITDKSSVVSAINELAGKVHSAISGGLTSVTAGQGISAGPVSKNTQTISIKLDPAEGNAATLSEAGLKVTIPEVTIPEYTIAEASTPAEGYLKSYELRKGGSKVGASINIPKDLVVSSGEVKTVETADDPYEGAVKGDLYLQLIIANQSTPVNIPVKSLTDVYTAGAYLQLSKGQFSVNYSSLKTQLDTDLAITTTKNKVTALETTVGDSTRGLVKDVTDIKNTLGSEESGLAKDVADNKAAIGVINGTGAGSISKAISDLKTEVLGGATAEYDTLGEVEAKIKGLQTNLDTLDGSAVKTITGSGIASASKGDAGEWTVTVNSEIDDTSDGATVENKTYSAKKITTLINELKVKDAANGSGTTVSKDESGVLTVNVLTDNDSVKIGDDGKLTVNIVDGGSF